MIISLENKYIYMAVPKTGTMSVQKFLLENDPTASENTAVIGGKQFVFRGHMTAMEIKEVLGEHYEQFNIIGFIRYPFSKVVSSYFFYRNGEPITAGNRNPWPTRLRVIYSRLMPFKLWALTYPYKSNIEYFIDSMGNNIVSHVGLFENLQSDLNRILNDVGVEIIAKELPHINKSKHSTEEKYYRSKVFRFFMKLRLKQDLKFYNGVNESINQQSVVR